MGLITRDPRGAGKRKESSKGTGVEAVELAGVFDACHVCGAAVAKRPETGARRTGTDLNPQVGGSPS